MSVQQPLLAKNAQAARFEFYGVDAPDVIVMLLVAAVLTGGTAGLLGLLGGLDVIRWSFLPTVILTLAITAGCCLFSILLMITSSLLLKFKERTVVLRALKLCGNERVLDIGCGRGFMTCGVAKQLTNGGVCHGIDIFTNAGQSSNTPASTVAAAARLGLMDRVDIQRADAQDLSCFEDAKFDCAVSTIVLHRIPDLDKAVSELARVLKPGGRVVSCDLFWAAGRVNSALAKGGFTGVSTTGPHFWIYPPVRVTTASLPSEFEGV